MHILTNLVTFIAMYISTRYPDYQFISDNTISQLAAEDKRYSVNSLYGVIFDITMLSKSDYLVCTFSSQVSVRTILNNIMYVHTYIHIFLEYQSFFSNTMHVRMYISRFAD